MPEEYNLSHILIIGRDPDGSALLIFNLRRQFGLEFLPELLRIAREHELRFGVIHHYNVAHGRTGRASGDHIAIDQCDLQTALGTLQRACRPHNTGADHYYVVSLRTHPRIPMANGSRRSTINSASAFTNAEPLMLG